MNFSNRDGVKKIKMVLLIVGVCWFLTMIAILIMEMFVTLAILAGLFLVVVMVIAILNFQFVRIIVVKNKMIVKYYSIFSVDRMFQMFDFRVDQLHNIEVYKNILGLKWDIVFTIRVQKGLANYPRVSLSAIPFGERSKLVKELEKFIAQN